MAFAQFIEYLKHEKRSSDHTVLAYENDLRQFHDYLSVIYEVEEIVQASHTQIRSWVVALIEQGTTVHQRTLTGTLATMVDLVAGYTVHAPTLIIVGSVVTLHPQLSWYGESKDPGSWPAPSGMV